MSAPVPPQIPPTDPTTTSPSSGAPTIPATEPYRFGASAPAWAVGKTAEEVLGVATQLNDALGQYVRTGTPAPTPTPAAPAATFGEGDYVTGADLSRTIASARDALTPQLQQVVEMAAGNALASVRRDNAEIFRKYEPEINAYLARIPKNMWNVDNLAEIVYNVKGRHSDEIAREHAGRLVAEMGPTLRSNGSPPAQPTPEEKKLTLQSDDLPADWKERAAKAGVTEAIVDEFCRANGMTRAAYFKMLPTAITEAPRR